MESRVNNATRNIIFGFLLNLYQIFIPFIIRTLMIYLIGMEYLGLNGLFASVLSVLNMTELGVGVAMIYTMYKPVAENDKVTICALLKLYKNYYRIIGTVIGVLGLCLMPFIRYLIKGSVPADINIYILYLMHLIALVLSYWVFAYKRSILEAHQRTDLIDKSTIIATTIQYLIQLIVVYFFRSYYAYVIVMLAGGLFKNITVAIIASKKYPDLHPYGDIDEKEKMKINQRIRDIFFAKLGGIIYGSADTIVISMSLGLVSLAIYDNYMYILNSIAGFISIVFTSVTASVGNSLVLETKEKNYQDFKTFSFIIFWICGICAACFLCLYGPFMRLWAGAENTMNDLYVICLIMYFYTNQFMDLLHLYKNASGMWREDRFRPFITSVINLVFNFILVRFWGLTGIVVSTWLSLMIVGMPWLINNLFNNIFKDFSKPLYIKDMLKYFVSVVLACSICYFIRNSLLVSDLLQIIISLVVCLFVTNITFFFFFRKTKEFEYTLDLFDAITRNKLEKLLNVVRRFC